MRASYELEGSRYLMSSAIDSLNVPGAAWAKIVDALEDNHVLTPD